MRVIDTHQHIASFTTIDNVITILRTGLADKAAMMAFTAPRTSDIARKNYIYTDGANLIQNSLMTYLKALLPEKMYIFGGLLHNGGIKGFDSYEKQAQRLWEIGFDGIKMLEGHHRHRNEPWAKLDDESYDAFYSFLEEKGITCTLHKGAPAYVYSESAMQAGFDMIFRVMKKHPKLKLNLAHLGFMDYHFDKAEAFLGEWENTTFDFCPHYDMYNQFAKDITRWRDFVLKYSDRIFYGTDLGGGMMTGNQDRTDTDEVDIPLYQYESQWLKSVLKEAYFDGKPRLALPEDVLEKIFAKNFENRVGAMPRALNYDLAMDECERMLGFAQQSSNRETVEVYLKYYLEQLKQMKQLPRKSAEDIDVTKMLPKDYPARKM